MANNELIEMIENWKAWKDMEEQAAKQRKEYEAKLKDFMTEQGEETYAVGRFIMRYTPVISNRFDTTEFKKDNKEIYELYLKQVPSMRFTVSE